MADSCSGVDPLCWIGSAAGDVASSATTSVFQEFVAWLMRGFLYGVREVLTAWVNVNGPDLTRPDGTVTQVHGQLLWLTMVVMLVATLVAAGKMVLLRDGRPAADFGKSVLITVFTAWGATALITSLMVFGDQFSAGLIDQSLSDEFIDKLAGNPAANTGAVGAVLGGVGAAAAGVPVSPALFLPLLIGLLAVAAQAGLMYFRIAVLIAMAAMLPLAAAGSATVTGRKWFERLVGWTFAFIVYKPVAAVLYVVGINFMQEDTDGITGIMGGIFLMVAAVLAMPALVKLMAPAAAATTGGSGGAVAAASVAAGAFGAPGRAAAMLGKGGSKS